MSPRCFSWPERRHDWRLVVIVAMLALAAMAIGSAVVAGDQSAAAARAQDRCIVFEQADATARTYLDTAQRQGLTGEARKDVDSAMLALVQAVASRSCYPAVERVRATN